MITKEHKQLLNLLDKCIRYHETMPTSEEYWKSLDGKRNRADLAALNRARRFIAANPFR